MSTRTDFELVSPFASALEDSGFAFEEIPVGEEKASFGEEDSIDDLTFFMNAAGRYELLDAAEERELGLRVWKSRALLLRILRRAKSRERSARLPLDVPLASRPITPSSRRRLLRVEEIARGVAEGRLRPERKSARRSLRKPLRELDEARRRLVEHNLRLVIWVAKQFRGRGFDFIDLIQEGSLGLMRAVDRFDPRVGARFSTFATHWVQQGIRRSLAEKGRFIRVPVNRIPEVRSILHARSCLSRKLGRAPLPEEIAKECGLRRDKVEELLPSIGTIDSIDAPIPATERLLKDTIEDRKRPSPLEDAIEAETRSTIEAVLHELPQRQRVILAMRHGIEYPRECTLDEIGDALGLSRERIRQVEKVATAAVREWIEKHRRELAKPV